MSSRDSSLPLEVAQDLARALAASFPGALVRTDAEGSVLARYGTPELLPELLPGVGAGEAYAPLAGQLPVPAPLSLPGVRLRGEQAVDLYLLPDLTGGAWISIVAAEERLLRHQVSQQRRNESALQRPSQRLRNQELAGVLRELEVLVLRPMDEEEPLDYRRLNQLPEWLAELWPQGKQRVVRPAERFPFLEAFAFDAAAVWRGESQRDTGCWTEAEGVTLEALAVPGPALILRRLDGDGGFEERRTLLQRGREAHLLIERLERERNLKEVLIHCIVHDLMGPLTSMRGTLDLVRELELEREEQLEVLRTGLGAAKRQESMIRGILDAFAAESQEAETFARGGPDAPDLGLSIRETVEQLAPAFRNSQVELLVAEFPERLRVQGERRRLDRVLSNLLENALQYGQRGSRVEVSLDHSFAGRVRVRIDDEGPGLDPEVAQALFTKFGQRRKGGKVGLGLYFCRITVERWGGAIGCEVRDPRGSRFWVELLLAE